MTYKAQKRDRPLAGVHAALPLLMVHQCISAKSLTVFSVTPLRLSEKIIFYTITLQIL